MKHIVIFASFLGFILAQEKLETSRDISFYQNPSRPKVNEEISNLYDNLLLFSNCLIYAINFEGLDMPASSESYELRKPIILIRFYSLDVTLAGGETLHLILPVEILKQIISAGNKTRRFTKTMWLHQYSKISQVNVMQHKPWRCETNLYLLPPEGSAMSPEGSDNPQNMPPGPVPMIDGLRTSQVLCTIILTFEMTFKKRYTYKTLRSSRGPIFSTEQRYDIFVAPYNHDDLLLWKYCIALVRRNLHVGPTSSWDVLHWQLFLLQQPKSNTLPHDRVLIIQRMVVISHAIDGCKAVVNPSLSVPKQSVSGIEFGQTLFSTIHSMNHNPSMFYALSDFYSPFSREDILHFYWTRRSYLLPTYYLTLILKNVSLYQMDQRRDWIWRSCKHKPLNFIQVTFGKWFHPYIKSVERHYRNPPHFTLSLTSYSFATCGSISTYTFSFNNLSMLTNIFGWVVIGTVYMVVYLTIHKLKVTSTDIPLLKSCSFLHLIYVSFMNTEKMNGPRTSFNLNLQPSNFVQAFNCMLVFIGGVVLLSNYKAVNVRLMVEKDDFATTTLKDLVDRSYTINMQPVLFYGIKSLNEVHLEEIYNLNSVVLHKGSYCLDAKPYNISVSTRLYFEISSFLGSETSCKNDASFLTEKEKNFISSASNFIPVPLRRLAEVLYNPVDYMVDVLANCTGNKNMAVVASESELLWLKYLDNVHHFKVPLSFGNEWVDTIGEGIQFNGWIPPNVISRLKSLYAMGLISYFTEKREGLYKSTGYSVDFNLSQKKINLHRVVNSRGVMVLYLTAAGYLVALCAWMYENRSEQALQRAKLFFDFVLQKIWLGIVLVCFNVRLDLLSKSRQQCKKGTTCTSVIQVETCTSK